MDHKQPDPIVIEEKDLIMIRSYACDFMQEFVDQSRNKMEERMVVTLCYVQAILKHFQSKDIIHKYVELKREE